MIVDEDLKYEIKLREEDKNYFELLTAKGKNYIELKSIGTIMTSVEFDEIWVNLDDINEKYNITERYISGPVKNMKEANDIASRIVEGTP